MTDSTPYVHFEGLDFAGKSTVVREFTTQSAENWEIRTNGLSADNPIKDFADNAVESGRYEIETRGLLYVASLSHDLDNFVWPEFNTIQESTVALRSLAYHAIHGTPRVIDALEGQMSRHPVFSASFVFTATYQERLRRLEMRENPTPHDLFMLKDPEQFMKMDALLISLSKKYFNSFVIDTTKIKEQDSARIVLEHLESRPRIQPS